MILVGRPEQNEKAAAVVGVDSSQAAYARVQLFWGRPGAALEILDEMMMKGIPEEEEPRFFFGGPAFDNLWGFCFFLFKFWAV